MLPKIVIDKFLSRELRDLRIYKKLTNDQLEQWVKTLPVRPPIWDELRLEQKVYFRVGVETKGIYVAADTGVGKTIISLALIKYFELVDNLKHVLVLVPNKPLKAEWRRLVKKHSPGTKSRRLLGSSLEKWEQLENTECLIIVETFGGFVRMCTKTENIKGKKRKTRLVPDKDKLKKLSKIIDGVIFDEITMVGSKSHQSTFRVLRQLVKHVKIRYGLTGTPFGRNPQIMWGQLFLIDDGETLGVNLGLFREAFFTSKINYFSGYPEWTIDRKKIPILHRTLANRSLRYEADESTLPRLIPLPKYVDLPADAETQYKKAWDELTKNQGNFIQQKNAFLRMRQISSGFLGYKDDDTGQRAQFQFDENPKLELLLDTLETIPEDRKFLVMHDFVYSGQIITKALKAAKINHVHLHSKADEEDVLEKFNDDPKVRGMITSTIGAFGLNLQIAQYGFFYERPVSPILQYQMIRRIERQYSPHTKVFLVDLIVNDTMDERIIEYYKEARRLMKLVWDRKDDDKDRATKSFLDWIRPQ